MLRPYADADLPGLLDVWYRASLRAHAFLPDEFFARERRDIAERWIPEADTTVVEIDGRIVGFLAMIGNEVGAIFVDPDVQRSGIGRTLMDATCARHPVVELDVFEANHAGRAFYARYGFEVIERRVDQDTGEPMLRLRFRHRTEEGSH